VLIDDHAEQRVDPAVNFVLAVFAATQVLGRDPQRLGKSFLLKANGRAHEAKRLAARRRVVREPACGRALKAPEVI
jgi:hypothetical protein